MKQFICLILCFTLALALSGCSKPETPAMPTTTEVAQPTEPADDLLTSYRAILTGEKTFFDIETAWPGSFEKGYRMISKAWSEDTYPSRFTLVDLDQDGENELILWLKQGSDSCYGFMVLDRQGDSTYGYQTTYRCFDQLKQDGTFLIHSDFSIDGTTDGIGRMRMDYNDWGSKYTAMCSTQYDSNMNILSQRYEIDGREAASEEYLDIYGRQADKPNAVWHLFTDANLASYGLLGMEFLDTPTDAQILDAFEQVVTGNGYFYDRSAQKETTIEEYRQEADMRVETSVTIPQIAAVDMDGDGIQEVILNIAINSNVDHAVWVLHYQEGEIQGQLYYHRQLGDIKEDGSFHWSGSASNNGTAKLVFGEDAWYYENVSDEGFEDKENVQWHPYPCDDLTELWN